MTTHALRLGPSMAAAVLALAVGTLVVGACVSTRSLIGFVAYGVGWWLFAAACLFAANQAWTDRSRAERVRIFGVCVLIVGAPFVPFLVLAVGVNVWELDRQAVSSPGPSVAAGSPPRRAGAIPNARIFR